MFTQEQFDEWMESVGEMIANQQFADAKASLEALDSHVSNRKPLMKLEVFRQLCDASDQLLEQLHGNMTDLDENTRQTELVETRLDQIA